jgi:hypothetical protein
MVDDLVYHGIVRKESDDLLSLEWERVGERVINKKRPFPSGFYEQFAQLCPDEELTSPDSDRRRTIGVDAAPATRVM